MACKPSDMISELQGRLPIRVELEALSQENLKRILTEPKASLIKQYKSLLATEGVEIEFNDKAIDRLAQLAFQFNEKLDNIGARRLHTVMEKVLEDLSFEAPELTQKQVTVDLAFIDHKLKLSSNLEDLSQWIL